MANGWAGIVVNGVVRDSVAFAALSLGLKVLGTNPCRSGRTGAGEVDGTATLGGVDFTPDGIPLLRRGRDRGRRAVRFRLFRHRTADSGQRTSSELMRLRSLVRDHGPAPAKIGIATSSGRRIGRGSEANAVTMHPRQRAWWSEDIPERETVPFFPCLAHFHTPGNQRGWFVVADPTLGLGVRSDGTASLPPYRTGVTEQAAVALGWIALIGVALVMITGTGPGPFLFGVVVLLIAVPLLMRPSIRGIHRIADQRALARTRRLREPRSYVVTPDDAAAWRLCILAGKIAVTAPWQDRTIDIARQLPVLLWSGAGRCLTVDRRRRDAEAALEHEALQDIARTTLADVADEARRLDAVEGHLTEILGASARLTQHRERMAAEEAIEKSRRAEERRLRQKLLHDAPTGRDPGADDEVDRTAGLSAEVTAVADLLTASEIALRRTSTRN